MKTWEIELQKAKTTCIACNKCMDNCPMLKEYCNSPKELLERLDSGEIIEDLAFACCQCSYCDAVCPTNTSLMKVFKTLKTEIQREKNFFPLDKGNLVVGFHQGNSFSPIFTGETNEKTKRAFFPGCSLLGYSQKLVQKTYEYMKTKDKDMGLIIHCCGNPTLTMGNEDKFKNRFSKTLKALKDKDVEELVIACANCYEVFKKYAPDIKIISLWEWINENGLPKQNYNIETSISFALHDPCPIRKRDEIHEAVREILKSMDLNFEEFDKNRRETLCCGSGAMVGVTKPEIAKKQQLRRANQTNSNYIVTYCESCVESMIAGGKQSVHILDLLFNEEDMKTQNYTQKIPTTSQKWMNRYKGSKCHKTY